jgi:glycosyltransferase involved in cell wall biosynthesis
MSFTQAIVRNRGDHEIILALNGLFPDTIEPIRAAFDSLLPQENIRVWYVPGPVRDLESANEGRREVAEIIREAFLASLQPDIIHLSSIFEGFTDDVVTSIGRFDLLTPVSVSLYDLIPLLNPEKFLAPNPFYKKNYLSKLEHLKKSSLYLAISQFTLEECQSYLTPDIKQFINVSAAIESHFEPLNLEKEKIKNLKQKFGITRPFIFYTGGADDHKNLPRLIEAFAVLNPAIRAKYQLVFGGRIHIVPHLKGIAKSNHLGVEDVIFTGYVTNEELLQFYNISHIVAFPSWHEGFGLPVLEAMSCGTPVICGNRSSLPEVIGLDEAMFDPFDVKAISAKLSQALEDENFRARLRAHGLQRAKLFSWDESAKKAILGFEKLHASRSAENHQPDFISSSQKLIQAISNQPNLQDISLPALSGMLGQNFGSGIERQLLVDVSELCQRDSATGVQRVVRSYLFELLLSPPKGFRVEPVYATREDCYRYARNFKNRFLGISEAELPEEEVCCQRGDIFFALDMQHHVQLSHGSFYSKIRSNGVTVKFLVYDLLPIQLPNLFLHSDASQLHEQLMTIVARSDEAICISKATADALLKWIKENNIPTSPNFSASWVHIGSDFDRAKPSKGISADAHDMLQGISSRPAFLWVSTIEPRKGQVQILDAFESLWSQGQELNLVFVGQQGWKMEPFAHRLEKHPENGKKLFWLKGISDEYLEKVYASSTCLVAASLNEGFGLPLIEAARHRLSIIARDIPVFREVAGEGAYYFKGFQAKDLAESVEGWLKLYKQAKHPKSDSLQWSTWKESTEKLKESLTKKNYPRKQIFLDISELVQRDVGSGIQRVVRSILKESLANPPSGYRIEPVYATTTKGYRYARQFSRRLDPLLPDEVQDEPIDFAPGDIFFGLDLQPQVVLAQRPFYQILRRNGVDVRFLIYDLLCVLMPERFPPGSAEGFSQWLDVVMESDGAICISKSVADQTREWFNKGERVRPTDFGIDWFHLGADTSHHAPLGGLPSDSGKVLSTLKQRKTFLIVSTIEPRKGHAQVLAAFEALWRGGVDVNLVIVGKQGWMVDELCEKLRAHSEMNHRLFWLEGISDEYLDKVYAASTCLISASYGEGFGLPLIEAAQHGLPILARDIAVFHEVAGKHSAYFKAEKPEELAQAIQFWLVHHQSNSHPKSTGIQYLNWKQSARNLHAILTSEKVKSKPQLFVDVSNLINYGDQRTGVHRVVRSILQEWFENPPEGYDICPVFANNEHCYHYAKGFSFKAIQDFFGQLSQQPIEYKKGDVFLGFDLDHHNPRTYQEFLCKMKDAGVRVVFIVYDLLPIHFPQFWEPQHSVDKVHSSWLKIVSKMSGVVCISKAVADEMKAWRQEQEPLNDTPFQIDWFHLGADINSSLPTTGFLENHAFVLQIFRKRSTFLMIGTIEPRKGHAQVLAAFEALWRSGVDVNLVIVGKQGWMVDDLCEKLRAHSEMNHRLFWLEGISDEYLEKVYAASTCLIAASYGEGFGLPLIEAAQHGLPILARDIPVFREVACEHAAYFSAETPNELAIAIKSWLADYQKNKHPKSCGMNYLTWKESAAMLLNKICQGETANDSEKTEPLACAS